MESLICRKFDHCFRDLEVEDNFDVVGLACPPLEDLGFLFNGVDRAEDFSWLLADDQCNNDEQGTAPGRVGSDSEVIFSQHIITSVPPRNGKDVKRVLEQMERAGHVCTHGRGKSIKSLLELNRDDHSYDDEADDRVELENKDVVKKLNQEDVKKRENSDSNDTGTQKKIEAINEMKQVLILAKTTESTAVVLDDASLESKLEITKKKIQASYEAIKNAKNMRRIQVIGAHEIPKPTPTPPSTKRKVQASNEEIQKTKKLRQTQPESSQITKPAPQKKRTVSHRESLLSKLGRKSRVARVRPIKV